MNATTTTCPDAPAGGTTCDIGTCARCDAAAGVNVNPFDTGRQLDWPTLQAQIGNWTVLAISGGRVRRLGPSTVMLPVSSGYSVRITLAANDTYTVERVLTRLDFGKVKGRMEGVYCDQVSDVAYNASCFRDGPWGQ